MYLLPVVLAAHPHSMYGAAQQRNPILSSLPLLVPSPPLTLLRYLPAFLTPCLATLPDSPRGPNPPPRCALRHTSTPLASPVSLVSSTSSTAAIHAFTPTHNHPSSSFPHFLLVAIHPLPLHLHSLRTPFLPLEPYTYHSMFSRIPFSLYLAQRAAAATTAAAGMWPALSGCPGIYRIVTAAAPGPRSGPHPTRRAEARAAETRNPQTTGGRAVRDARTARACSPPPPACRNQRCGRPPARLVPAWPMSYSASLPAAVDARRVAACAWNCPRARPASRLGAPTTPPPRTRLGRGLSRGTHAAETWSPPFPHGSGLIPAAGGGP